MKERLVPIDRAGRVVLPKLRAPFRHSPEQALLGIEENILKHFKISSLAGGDHAALIREAAAAGIQGGAIYDAAHMKSAGKADVDRIFTLNPKHFQAVASQQLVAILSTP